MFEVTILIPVTNNDGDAFGPAVFAAFEASILDAFGGFSVLPTDTIGAWRNDAGVVYRDRSRGYVIAVSSIAQGAAIVALAEQAKVLFEQEAIAFRYLGQLEII